MANFTIPEKLMSCLAPLPDAVKGKIVFAIFNMLCSCSEPETESWSCEERSLWAFVMQMLAPALRRRNKKAAAVAAEAAEVAEMAEVISDDPEVMAEPEAIVEARRNIGYINKNLEEAGLRTRVSIWQWTDPSGRDHIFYGVPQRAIETTLDKVYPMLILDITRARRNEIPCSVLPPFSLYHYPALPGGKSILIASESYLPLYDARRLT